MRKIILTGNNDTKINSIVGLGICKFIYATQRRDDAAKIVKYFSDLKLNVQLLKSKSQKIEEKTHLKVVMSNIEQPFDDNMINRELTINHMSVNGVVDAEKVFNETKGDIPNWGADVIVCTIAQLRNLRNDAKNISQYVVIVDNPNILDVTNLRHIITDKFVDYRNCKKVVINGSTYFQRPDDKKIFNNIQKFMVFTVEKKVAEVICHNYTGVEVLNRYDPIFDGVYILFSEMTSIDDEWKFDAVDLFFKNKKMKIDHVHGNQTYDETVYDMFTKSNLLIANSMLSIVEIPKPTQKMAWMICDELGIPYNDCLQDMVMDNLKRCDRLFKTCSSKIFVCDMKMKNAFMRSGIKMVNGKIGYDHEFIKELCQKEKYHSKVDQALYELALISMSPEYWLTDEGRHKVQAWDVMISDIDWTQHQKLKEGILRLATWMRTPRPSKFVRGKMIISHEHWLEKIDRVVSQLPS